MKTKFFKQVCALALCGTLLFGNNIMSYASVKDNVGGMDTSVDKTSPHNEGGASGSEILTGYAAWVNGDLINGKMPNMAGKTISYPNTTDAKVQIGNADDSEGLKTTDAIGQSDDGKNALIKVPKGYYDKNSTLSIPIETIKQEVSSLSSSIINLGQDTSYDIKALNPNIDYTKLNNSNFIIEITTMKYTGYDYHGNTSYYGGDCFTKSLNYNPTTGLLTVSVISKCPVGINPDIGNNITYSTISCSISYTVFLIV